MQRPIMMHLPPKTRDERLQGYIYLGSTKNFQGSCKFIRLITGQRITRKKLAPLPMSKYVIKQVEDMAIKEDFDKDLIFTDINGRNL